MGALDLRAEASRALEAGTPKTAPKALTPREHAIDVTYRAPSGEVLACAVVSRIMSGDERVARDRMAAALAVVPWTQLPPGAASRLWAVATVAIQVRERPAWVDQWMQEDDALLFALLAEAEAHTDRYFRGDPGTGAENAQQPRVVVAPRVAP